MPGEAKERKVDEVQGYYDGRRTTCGKRSVGDYFWLHSWLHKLGKVIALRLENMSLPGCSQDRHSDDFIQTYRTALMCGAYKPSYTTKPYHKANFKIKRRDLAVCN